MTMENISEMDDAPYLKRNDESLCLTILVSLNSMAEVWNQEKPSSLKKSHDKKERVLVIGWVAVEEQVAVLTDGWGRWSSESPTIKWGAPGPKMKWKEVSHSMLTKDKKRTWFKSCKECSETEHQR